MRKVAEANGWLVTILEGSDPTDEVYSLRLKRGAVILAACWIRKLDAASWRFDGAYTPVKWGKDVGPLKMGNKQMLEILKTPEGFEV